MLNTTLKCCLFITTRAARGLPPWRPLPPRLRGRRLPGLPRGVQGARCGGRYQPPQAPAQTHLNHGQTDRQAARQTARCFQRSGKAGQEQGDFAIIYVGLRKILKSLGTY